MSVRKTVTGKASPRFQHIRRLSQERAGLRDYIKLWGHRSEPHIQKRVESRRKRLELVEWVIARRIEEKKEAAV